MYVLMFFNTKDMKKLSYSVISQCRTCTAALSWWMWERKMSNANQSDETLFTLLPHTEFTSEHRSGILTPTTCFWWLITKYSLFTRITESKVNVFSYFEKNGVWPNLMILIHKHRFLLFFIHLFFICISKTLRDTWMWKIEKKNIYIYNFFFSLVLCLSIIITATKQ